jgi:hypothetical protein
MNRAKLCCPLFALALFTAACRNSVSAGDAALKPYAAMYAVDRGKYGFTPLPTTGTVMIEGRSSSGAYDAMLHYGGNPSRSVAFHWDGRAYQWLGEQEVFDGPRTYDTPDGMQHEEVVISFYVAPVYGVHGLSIGYEGPDRKLMFAKSHSSLTLEEVSPLLQEWGFRQ